MTIPQLLSSKTSYSIWDKIGKHLFHREITDSVNKNQIGISTDPIFIYQMGRVGSTSVKLSLEQAYRSLSINTPIFHGHYLSNFRELEDRVKEDLEDTTHFMHDLIEVYDSFHKLMGKKNDHQKVKIISLVRDPVARNVSTFFYALDEFVPDWNMKISNHMLSIDDLHAIFESKRSFVLNAFNWFDEQMKPVFGIDVYSIPFPKDLGFRIYSTTNVDLLLFRLEDLNKCAKKAIVEFLGVKNFKLMRVNTSEERKAADLYRLFKNRPLSTEYVKWTYNTKLARHFYTEAEIDTFVHKWTSGV